MLKAGLFFLLAFGIPGLATDEHLASTQQNDWNCREYQQEI
jgi:hypothetical protein